MGTIVTKKTGGHTRVFSLNDIYETGSVTYFGKEDRRGNWLIERIEEYSGSETRKRYASELNNVTYTDYASAWSNKESLTLGSYDEVL